MSPQRKTAKESTNREILNEVGLVKLEVTTLKLDVADFKFSVNEKFESYDNKFDVVIAMIDNLTKKVTDMHDEQKAGFTNYSRLNEKVEAHDKDIVRIKTHLKMAAA
jgi:predicted  nucleic acid-binding Zn-ribbon protein